MFTAYELAESALASWPKALIASQLEFRQRIGKGKREITRCTVGFLHIVAANKGLCTCRQLLRQMRKQKVVYSCVGHAYQLDDDKVRSLYKTNDAFGGTLEERSSYMKRKFENLFPPRPDQVLAEAQFILDSSGFGIDTEQLVAVI